MVNGNFFTNYSNENLGLNVCHENIVTVQNSLMLLKTDFIYAKYNLYSYITIIMNNNNGHFFKRFINN